MELYPRFLGLSISDSGSLYTYSYTPFTESSKLVDENGVLIAELKRFGWFTLNFNLFTGNAAYILKCSVLNNEMITPEGQIFSTNSSTNFYSNGKQLTELKHNSRFGKYATLEVFSREHKAALVIASCLFTVRYLHGGI